MRSMKKRSTLAALLLTAACVDERTTSELTKVEIGAAGGRALSADGRLELVFPAGALGDTTEITVATERGLLAPRAASPVYELGPSGLRFASPVALRIRGDRVSGRVVLAQIEGGAARALAGSTRVVGGELAEAPLEHFSAYAAIVAHDPCAGLACGDPCTFCDPADPTCVEPSGMFVCDLQSACVLAVPGAGVQCVLAGPDAGVADSGVEDAGAAPDAEAEDAAGDPDAQPAPDGGIPAGSEIEPNDDPATAHPLSVGPGGSETVTARRDPGTDVDHFRVEIPLGTAARLIAWTHAPGSTTCASGIDTVLTLLDQSGTMLMENDDYAGGMFCSRVDTVLSGGTYYLRVRGFATGASFAYGLTVQLAPPGGVFDAGTPADAGAGAPDGSFFPPDAGGPPADAGVSTAVPETEPNGSTAQANYLFTGPGTATATAAIDPAGDHDYYAVDVPGGATQALHAITHDTFGAPNACASRIDTVLTLYDAAGNQLAENDDNGTPCSEINATLAGGRYYLRVRHFVPNRTIGQYYLTVTLQ